MTDCYVVVTLWWHVQVASEAAMRAPEEVYKGQQQGAPKAAEELSREERTRLRAKKKRAGKKHKLQQVVTLICRSQHCFDVAHFVLLFAGLDAFLDLLCVTAQSSLVCYTGLGCDSCSANNARQGCLLDRMICNRPDVT